MAPDTRVKKVSGQRSGHVFGRAIGLQKQPRVKRSRGRYL